MSELLNSLSEDNLVLLCVIMGIIALFLAIAISIEIYNNNKKINKLIFKDKTNDDEDEIKYVEEDEELERTKARLELANLREKLKKEEDEKRKLLEMNLALCKEDKKTEKTTKVKEKTNTEKVTNNVEIVKEEKNINTEVSNIETQPVTEIKEESTNKPEKKKEIVTIEIKKTPEIEILDDEEDAIISYDELKKSTNFGYTDEEMDLYVDEEDAIISIDELEKLYKESEQIETIQYEVKHVEDLPEISSDKKFQSTPMISPVYGVTSSESELILEQTANLEKLNEEIKKTNEFLKTLKDLKKNLD